MYRMKILEMRKFCGGFAGVARGVENQPPAGSNLDQKGVCRKNPDKQPPRISHPSLSVFPKLRGGCGGCFLP